MTRGGRKIERTEPQRTCIVTRVTHDKSDLIRFVVGPDASVVPDIANKLPGKGIYTCANGDVIEKAVAKGLFSKAAKMKVSAASELPKQVAEILSARLVQSLALARKAGLAIAGFEKVKALLVSGDAVALFQASDGSDAMKSKLRSPNGPESYVDCLSSADLGVAFGRDTVIHAALTAGGIADVCLNEANRLKGVVAPWGAK